THQRATLISAAWFLLLHVPRWIFLGRLGTASTIRFLLSVFVFGLLLPYLVRSTNSLWSAIAVHISNNFLGHAFR
ncbi:MAG: type II CAAX prenyl endopeptidase Rce1 family protein, partial [Candidatus Promineifilaceae bacterium]